jgi:invasion protein IalB
VKDEVSMLVTGYAFKPNSEASLSIGSTPFAMYTQNDGAWVKNAADEARMVDAIRKGADMAVKGTTSRGTQTTDTFSLKGVAQALDRVAQECN